MKFYVGMFFLLCTLAAVRGIEGMGNLQNPPVENVARKLVLVAGPSGAGKTAFVEELAASIRRENRSVLIIKQDDYYNELIGMTPEQKAKVNFDHPESLDFARLRCDLSRIMAGNALFIPQYDFATHSRKPNSALVFPADVIIVEGILVLSQLVDLEALMIYVHADDETCFQRRLVRDQQERGRQPEDIEWQYNTTVRPMAEKFVWPSKAHAHYVFSSEGDAQAQPPYYETEVTTIFNVLFATEYSYTDVMQNQETAT